MKKIMIVIKKIVVAICMLYTFNLIVAKTGYIVPINTFSILLISYLGIPGILSLLLIKIMI